MHRGLRNLLHWYVHDLGFTTEDSVLLVTSHSFDLTQKNIFAPLSVGATLHLATESFEPRALLEVVRREGIRCLNMAPSAFHALIDANDADQLRSVRRVTLGGEPIQVHKLLQLPEARPQFVNSYGPTECSDVVAWHVLREPLQQYEQGGVPLGQPLRNTRLYVLDAHGSPVPIGVAGELYIGGIAVARGYLNRPELTAERFVADPFCGEPGARMYKTGDLGRWLADGNIEFLGRNDFQVKIRGFRIELGEIEARLAEVPGIREAVVLAREDSPGDKRLVAYVVGEAEDDAPEPAMLRAHLARACPSTWCPAPSWRWSAAADAQRQARPQGAAGARRRGLGAAQLRGAGGRDRSSAGRASGASCCDVERVGRHDHFFELGGHSLLAVQLISRLREQLGVELALSALFAQPCLSDLAQQVAEATQSQLGAIEPADRTRGAAAVVRAAAPVVPRPARCAGRARRTTCRGAAPARRTGRGGAASARWTRIVARHEALRTTLRERRRPAASGHRCAQRLCAEPPGPQRRRRRGAASWRAAWKRAQPFDLAAGPLIRGRLLRLAEDDHVLLVTMHHIVTDGWSIGVLVRELSSAVRGLQPRAGRPAAAAGDPVRRLRRLAAPVAARRAAAAAAGATGAAPARRAGAAGACPPTGRGPRVQNYAGARIDGRARRGADAGAARRSAGATARRCS